MIGWIGRIGRIRPIRMVTLLLIYALAGCYSPERPTDYAPKTHALELTQEAMTKVDGGALEEALQLLDQAIAEDPGYPLPYKNKAAVLGKLERFQDAAEALTALLTKHPDDADAYLAQGVFQERAGNKAEARICYATAAEKYAALPNRPETDLDRRLALVQCAYLLSGRAEGLKKINELLDKYPENSLAMMFKYRILADQREAFLAGGLNARELGSTGTDAATSTAQP